MKAIERNWLARAEQYCFRARLERPHYDGPVFARGEGTLIWDVEGKEYLDFNSGQLCSALGHNPPRVVEAVADAARTMIHSSSTYYNVAEIRLAEKLAELLPQPLRKTMFGLSGSDATEAAINIAKKVTGRYEVASPHVSFHGLGDTPRALSYGIWRQGIAPSAPGTFAVLAPYCFRCPIDKTYPDCELTCLTASRDLLDSETTAPVAAIITEPLFSAGGVIEPPPGWLEQVATACRERDALLILDESQTGLAKLGTMWGCERTGVVPDLLVISKHFGGGIAISAVAASEELEAEAIDRGFVYAHSHSSDPLACAAAHAALTTIQEDGLVARAQAIGATWRAHLEDLRARHASIVDVRGAGTLQAVELGTSEGEPAVGLGDLVGRECLELGLLFSVRRRGSVLRFTPPFSTTDEQMETASALLDRALSTAAREYERRGQAAGAR